MATNLVRFDLDGTPRWGVVSGSGVSPLAGDYPTTAALIERGKADWRAAKSKRRPCRSNSIKILPPVTTPRRIYCQGANYRQHMIESGMDPDAKLFNMFFTKSDASIASARERRQTAEARRAARLRDRARARIPPRDRQSRWRSPARRLRTMSSAIAIANDFSARDVQLPQTQFFKGKSYRGFCPLGPVADCPRGR